MEKNQHEAEREMSEVSQVEQPSTKQRVVISRKRLRIERVPVELPDGGQLRLFPYISAGAMDAALSAKDEKGILQSLLDKSAQDEPPVVSSSFSDADWDHIARHLLRSAAESDAEFVEVIECYERGLNQHGDRRHAFAVALKSTREWDASQESRKRQIASIQRIVDQHQSVATAIVRQMDLLALRSPAMEALTIVDRYSIQLPTIHQEFQSSIDRVSSQLESLVKLSQPRIELAFPKFELPNPMSEAMERVQTQLGTFQLVQKQHLEVFGRVEAILDSYKLPDVPSLVDFSALNNAIASSFAQTLEANRLFSSAKYLSPRRIRDEILRPDDSKEWVDELEDSEVAIVAETVATQEAIGDIVKRDAHRYLRDKPPHKHPALNQFIESMTHPVAFFDVLCRFARRVAREDSRLFWSDYGRKFNPSPEAIGKALLGIFLEGHSRGTAFVAHELHVGEGYVDVVVFFMNKTFIIELKVVGANWSFGKAESGLNQLQCYDDLYANAELFMVVFDGRKTQRGKQLPEECKLDNGKTARVLTVPIFSIAPTRKA